MTTNEIINTLAEDKKLDRVQLEKAAPKIDALSPDIKEALENWISTDVIESPTYSGYDVNAILKAQPFMTVFGAYLSLDWLRRDPKTAQKALSRKTTVLRVDK
ncbi:MAG: hypothetical protein LUE20_05190 [Oscillospiraceae bacterium]|nr:hypothetical protein [Oscillospiraceae bacterium]